MVLRYRDGSQEKSCGGPRNHETYQCFFSTFSTCELVFHILCGSVKIVKNRREILLLIHHLRVVRILVLCFIYIFIHRENGNYNINKKRKYQ